MKIPANVEREAKLVRVVSPGKERPYAKHLELRVKV